MFTVFLKNKTTCCRPKNAKLLSMLGFGVTLTIVILEMKGFLISPKPKIGSDYIALVLFALGIFIPMREWIFAVVTLVMGLINIYYGGHLLGLLFYAFSLSVGLRLNWFRHKARLKTSLFILTFFLVLLSQLKYGLEYFIISFVNILIGCSLITGFLVLFNDTLKAFYNEKPILDLSNMNFGSRKISCIQGIVDRKSTTEIANMLATSPSVIKKEFVSLYTDFNVTDYVEFRIFIDKHTIVFPEEKTNY